MGILDFTTLGIVLAWFFEFLTLLIVRPLNRSFKLILLCTFAYLMQLALSVPQFQGLLSVLGVKNTNCSLPTNLWGVLTSLIIFFAVKNWSWKKASGIVITSACVIALLLVILSYIEKPSPVGCLSHYYYSPRWFSLYWWILFIVHIGSDLYATIIAIYDARKLRGLPRLGVSVFALAFLLGVIYYLLFFLYFLDITPHVNALADTLLYPIHGYIFLTGFIIILFAYLRDFVKTWREIITIWNALLYKNRLLWRTATKHSLLRPYQIKNYLQIVKEEEGLIAQSVNPISKSDNGLDEIIASEVDPSTVALLRSLKDRVPPHAVIVDVGCGEGIQAKEIAEMWPESSITAWDIDSSLFPTQYPKNVTFHHTDVHDSTSKLYKLRADLVHTRFLYAHLPDRERLIQQLYDKVVLPGGFLVIGEAYFCPPEDTAHPDVKRYLHAYFKLVKDYGTDFSWIRRVPAFFAAQGATVNLYAAPTHLGGGEGHDKWLSMINAFENLLIENEYITLDEISRAKEALKQPDSFDSPQIIFTVIVEKPLF